MTKLRTGIHVKAEAIPSLQKHLQNLRDRHPQVLMELVALASDRDGYQLSEEAAELLRKMWILKQQDLLPDESKSIIEASTEITPDGIRLVRAI